MAAETILENREKSEAAVVLQVLEGMTQDEQQSLLLFMQGAMYAKEIYTTKAQRGGSDGRG